MLDGFRWTNFFLAYQGERRPRPAGALRGNRGPGARPGRAGQWRAPIAREPVRGRRIRIGFASAFLHVGTVGRYFQSWITALPRERFEVFAYHLWPGMDAVAQRDRCPCRSLSHLRRQRRPAFARRARGAR